MIGFYNYTVILTYIGTFFGFLGITFSWSGNTKAALICLMAAGFCDMFDGKVASTMKRTKQEKRFGVQIDSLSDLVCFGVLPALIVFPCTEGKPLHIVVCAAYVLCALIRLAWFNVDEEERQDREDKGREVYTGLPVTTSAMLLPVGMAAMNLLSLSVAKLSVCLIAVIAVAFITPFKLKKPGKIGKILVILCGIGAVALVAMGI